MPEQHEGYPQASPSIMFMAEPAPQALEAEATATFSHEPGMPRSTWQPIHEARLDALHAKIDRAPAHSSERAELEHEARTLAHRALTGGDHSQEARDNRARAVNIERSWHADS